MARWYWRPLRETRASAAGARGPPHNLGGARPPWARAARPVGHVSGATGLGALHDAAERGAAVFSLHPLQTVPDARAELAGAPCAVAGSSGAALALAERLALALGMRPFEV